MAGKSTFREAITGGDGATIGKGAQEMHTGELSAGRREPARPAAGREQQRVVRQHRVIVEPHALLAPPDLVHAPAQLRLHLVLGEELRRADDQALALERAGQVLLRQRRPLVRQPRLIAH